MNPFFSSLFAHKVTGKERAFCAHFAYINIFTQRILLPLNPPGSNSKKYKPTKKPIYLHEVTLAAIKTAGKPKAAGHGNRLYDRRTHKEGY